MRTAIRDFIRGYTDADLSAMSRSLARGVRITPITDAQRRAMVAAGAQRRRESDAPPAFSRTGAIDLMKGKSPGT